MRLPWPAGFGLLGLALLAGCGATTGAPRVTAGSPPVATWPAADSPPPGPVRGAPHTDPIGPPVTALATRPGPAPASSLRLSLPWRLVALTDDGRTLVVSYLLSGCQAVGWAQLSAGRGYLTVTLWGWRLLDAYCPELEALRIASVALPAPLGDRALRGAAVGVRGP